MEWVETPGKGKSASALLRDFEERFARLSTLDRTLLDTSRVLLFVKSVDARDREKIGLLLETDDGLTTEWAVVKRVCGRFDKRCDWAETDSVGAGAATTKRVEATPPARKEEARRWPAAARRRPARPKAHPGIRRWRS
jgi:phosphopantothenoylcysteine synthetase/decarboxylase